ncbi:MAG: ThiF family adenylyltransferase [Victivallaceae bacterium]|nr:ThiF family adenylyltransferase [Victivallaceae bacterium]
MSVTDRQSRLPDFDQQALEKAHIILIGGGGIGSELAEGLVRKGVGRLTVYDHDVVEMSNLNRQHFFKKDIGKNKAVQLVRNISKHATCGTVLNGYACNFQDAVVLEHDLNADIVICGVDNNAARVAVSEYYRKRNIPVIFIAVDYMAENGYVFVQEFGGLCFGCAFPRCLEKRKAPCFTPAVKDILKVVAGIALYAVDTLIMERRRNWNYRNIHLAGFAPSQELTITKNPKCPLCNKQNMETKQ